MDASYFIDGKERIFIPYKGWNIINTDGTFERDELTSTDEGPLKNIPDPLSHGNWHTLENLITPEGNKVLKKGVREIRYIPEGYYHIRDNNEDELINRGDVRGGFKASDYIEQANVVSKDGKLLSDIWFDTVGLLVNGYFLASMNGVSNLMDINGDMLLEKHERNLLNFIGGVAYSYHDGKLFANDSNGQKIIRQLNIIDDKDRFNIYIAGMLPTCVKYDRTKIVNTLKSSRYKPNELFLIQRESDYCMNLIDINGFVMFENWYDRIYITAIKGLYIVRDSDRWNLINLGGDILNGENIGQPVTYFKHNQMVVEKENTYGIVDTQGNILLKGFTSAMWASPGVWNINVASFGKEYYGLHGDGNGITNYAHEVLISHRGNFLLEKNNIWYLVNPNGDLKAILKAAPSEVTNNLKLNRNTGGKP